MSKKNNTNKSKGKKITISQILDNDDSDSEFYRDIFRYVIGKKKGKIKSKVVNKKAKIKKVDEFEVEAPNTEFRVWELSKWLLETNRELREKTRGSHESTYHKTHSKIQNVTVTLQLFEKLDLVLVTGEVPSLRNPKIYTKVYDVTPLGLLVASLVEFKILTKGTSEYKEALKSLLNLWINYIPPGNKDWGNNNYHFLKGLVERCIENHDDLLLEFMDFIRQRTPDLIFNFGDLRYKANNMIFKKLIFDKKFRDLYFTWLSEFCRNEPLPTNTEGLIKFQFKLDVETQYERSLSQLLNFSSLSIKTFQWNMRPHNRNLSYGEAGENDNFDKIHSEIVFDYNIKNQWEQIRNENLLNFDKITILMKCNNCGRIYPLRLGILEEIEDLSEHISKYGSRVQLYDFENDSNGLYLKKICSTLAVI